MESTIRAYLNSAGTSWPKPEPVHAAVRQVAESDPMAWAERFARDHASVAAALGVPVSQLLPTPGCTSALALGLADMPWEPGDRLLVSSFEHHGLMRPAELLARRGVEVVRIPPAGDRPLDVAVLETELRRGARCVAISHAANVTGALLPVDDVIALARSVGCAVLVDAAQSAGWLPLPDADVVTVAGHKGPHAPWGIGALVVRPGVAMVTPAAACTLDDGPTCAPMPSYCDAGSVNRSALAGFAAGLEWMSAHGSLATARARLAPVEALVRRSAVVHGPPAEARMPTLAFSTEKPAELARALRAEGIVVSAGLQCSPVAHETMGTAPDGVVRISVGPMIEEAAMEHACTVLHRLL